MFVLWNCEDVCGICAKLCCGNGRGDGSKIGWIELIMHTNASSP